MPGLRTRLLAPLEDRHAGNDRRLIPIHTLHQPLAAGRQIMPQFRMVQPQRRQIHNIDIGFLAHRQPSTVMEAEEIRRLAGQPLHHEFQWKSRAAVPVAHPVSQHVGRQA